MLEHLIVDLSHDPFNPVLNFDVAVEYERLNQTASAVSFYLRCAEYGLDTHPEHTYASLLKLAKCFEDQNDRVNTVSNCLLQAITYLPYRQEGYFLLARFHERLSQWQECYTFAELGLRQHALPDLPIDVEYKGEYCLRFEKAVSAYWLGRSKESLKLFTELSYESISDEYANAVKSNLEKIANASI
jgi:tetratricopeptide (TPR) repeat protein